MLCPSLSYLSGMIIGITGQIGSGKSTVARIFKRLGAAVIDADKIGRDVVETNPELLSRLTSEFGPGILGKTGKLRRGQLALLAFATEDAKARLNRIVHPHLLKELRRQARELSRRNELIVIDAALLLDWNLDTMLDAVVVIHAPEKTRLQRLEGRGISREDVRARQKRQLPFSEYRRRADFVVLNNQSVDKLESKLRKLARKLIGKTVDL